MPASAKALSLAAICSGVPHSSGPFGEHGVRYRGDRLVHRLSVVVVGDEVDERIEPLAERVHGAGPGARAPRVRHEPERSDHLGLEQGSYLRVGAADHDEAVQRRCDRLRDPARPGGRVLG